MMGYVSIRDQRGAPNPDSDPDPAGVGAGIGVRKEKLSGAGSGSDILTHPDIPRKTIFLLYYDKIDRGFSGVFGFGSGSGSTEKKFRVRGWGRGGGFRGQNLCPRWSLVSIHRSKILIFKILID